MDTLDLSPAFVRLARHLQEQIVSGTWLPGHLLPGEVAIAKQFGVSVGTARKALDVLSGQRLIERRRGRGTCVMRATDERAFTSFFRLVRRRDGERALPTDVLLQNSSLHASADERRGLDLKSGELVHRIKRRRLLDGHPAVLETISLPSSRLPGFAWPDDPRTLHLVYLYLEQHCGISIARVEDRICASMLGPVEAREFKLKSRTPVLKVLRRSYDLQGRPIELRTTLMHTERHDYLSELKWSN